eukprot:5441560-Ditylum_brightwellii.AAC.1
MLHHAYQVVEYWKAVMSFERNKIKGNYILELCRQEIDLDVDIFQGEEKRKAPAQLRKAKKHLTKCRNNSYKLRQEYLQRKAEEMVPGGEKEEIQKMVKRMKHQGYPAKNGFFSYPPI